jgi:hypothetical protein
MITKASASISNCKMFILINCGLYNYVGPKKEAMVSVGEMAKAICGQPKPLYGKI